MLYIFLTAVYEICNLLFEKSLLKFTLDSLSLVCTAMLSGPHKNDLLICTGHAISWFVYLMKTQTCFVYMFHGEMLACICLCLVMNRSEIESFYPNTES